jgi:hypothetical protein
MSGAIFYVIFDTANWLAVTSPSRLRYPRFPAELLQLLHSDPELAKSP